MTQHLVNSFRSKFAARKATTAIRFQENGEWQDITWSELLDNSDRVAKALLFLGCGVQTKVGIFANNRPEWSFADLGILAARCVTVPIYPTNTTEQTRYIINNADIDYLFVGGQEQFDKALELLISNDLKLVVALTDTIDLKGASNAMYFSEFIQQGDDEAADAEFEQRLTDASMDDLVTLIYTSGTTGQPKGVMLDYTNFAAAFSSHDKMINVSETDTSIAFLPLSHVLERSWSFYLMHCGAQNVHLENPKLIIDVIAEIKPTLLVAVPRLYEKIYSTIHSRLESASAVKKALFGWATNVGLIHFKLIHCNQQPSLFLSIQHKLADKLIFSKLRGILGGNTRFLPCGGAKVDPDINIFFQSIGIELQAGYGMTETTATVCCHRGIGYDFASIGLPLPDMEVKIGADNEILVRGDTVMKGYYKMPEETEKNFIDGWLKTGDAGKILANGEVVMTERIKELMKTSNGKYIAPQLVEGTLNKDHFIDQVAIVADSRHFVSALIVPSFDALEEYANSINLQFSSKAELLRHSHIVTMFEKRVQDLQSELANFEKVKKFKLLSREFCMKKGEITPTLKLRRKVIESEYKKDIDEMYKSDKK
ncbi:AMP-dependent synthetase/ligase [Moritella viscosa]|uniref:AMP-dependent synthetase/ligase n=1 Tax=Moritella viscosa TaxID=80854 RepID=UPI00091855B9|nr:long-chain fatty acid--CoA ligase [Moritella viscosa]SGY94366.1 Tyrocidine synthase 3-Tyrocidine synthase III-ATP-dependent asparagine adenylase-Asparagine activase-ATP-dependent glutamine adenylase-Glutamine activase-ATP-dependent tyrosine adenylase-Tyrosine activase-ATP-dependent valine adenylase-Valine activase-ATP-dependent ornithine adenylase-Ornithine activase-ATP-dependent leucine adenylase-Leucine activase [Moritella viscosa]SGY94754.1 Tyrocidine synthase 3-Tyrocidine synthase III-ATP-